MVESGFFGWEAMWRERDCFRKGTKQMFLCEKDEDIVDYLLFHFEKTLAFWSLYLLHNRIEMVYAIPDERSPDKVALERGERPKGSPSLAFSGGVEDKEQDNF